MQSQGLAGIGGQAGSSSVRFTRHENWRSQQPGTARKRAGSFTIIANSREALVLPSLLHEQRETKRAKLLQYAERVWGLTTGTEDERISGGIEATRAFFEGLGVPTRLRAYDIQAGAIDALVASLQAHGMSKLGERGDVTPAVSRRILEGAL